jgi:ABC-type transport system involved in multi-copper enzyme maturation permease subunit
MYSLTAASSRTHVLLAKMIVVSIYSILLTALVTGIAPLLTKLGMAVRGVDLAAQNLPFMDIWLHAIFYGWAFSMLALLIAAIVRSQVGTLAILLLFPVLGESLLSLLLKENAKYLPFTALGQVLQSAIPGQLRGVMLNLSGTQAILVVLAYIAGLGLLAWLLFRRRDAN